MAGCRTFHCRHDAALAIPIVTLWGKTGAMFYNDAYSIFAGSRQPALLGCDVREGWPEVTDFNDNVLKSVYERNETLSSKDQEPGPTIRCR